MYIYLLIFILFIIALYLFAIMPKVINKVDFTPFKGRHYAHRGFHGDKNISPENSMAAFKLAVDNDYGIEFDIQLSKDNIPVVFHDEGLKRVCGIDKNVNDYNYQELKEISLFGSQERIPHLKDVLNLVDGKVPLIVELKGETSDTSIAGYVAPYLDDYKGVYCIESFNPFILLWFKKNKPNIVRGQLTTQFKDKGKAFKIKVRDFILENLMLNFLTKPDFIAYNHLDPDSLAFSICKNLYRSFTVAYTIQSNEDLKSNLNRFDLFIFDKFTPTV